MGACSSKDGSEICDDDVRGLKEKVRLLREEVRGVVSEMDKVTKAHEKDKMVFAFKEAGWKTEKKRLKEEVKMLRKRVNERITEIEERNFGDKTATERKMEGTPNIIFGQIQQERAHRDEAIEKWKQLYHAIKIELDDLIQRTHNGMSMNLSFLLVITENLIFLLFLNFLLIFFQFTTFKLKISVRNHDSPQWYDIVHFEHKLLWFCFWASPEGLVRMEMYSLLINS